jgi:hypothetical protein
MKTQSYKLLIQISTSSGIMILEEHHTNRAAAEAVGMQKIAKYGKQNILSMEILPCKNTLELVSLKCPLLHGDKYGKL